MQINNNFSSIIKKIAQNFINSNSNKLINNSSGSNLKMTPQDDSKDMKYVIDNGGDNKYKTELDDLNKRRDELEAKQKNGDELTSAECAELNQTIGKIHLLESLVENSDNINEILDNAIDSVKDNRNSLTDGQDIKKSNDEENYLNDLKNGDVKFDKTDDTNGKNGKYDFDKLNTEYEKQKETLAEIRDELEGIQQKLGMQKKNSFNLQNMSESTNEDISSLKASIEEAQARLEVVQERKTELSEKQDSGKELSSSEQAELNSLIGEEKSLTANLSSFNTRLNIADGKVGSLMSEIKSDESKKEKLSEKFTNFAYDISDAKKSGDNMISIGKTNSKSSNDEGHILIVKGSVLNTNSGLRADDLRETAQFANIDFNGATVLNGISVENAKKLNKSLGIK